MDIESLNNLVLAFRTAISLRGGVGPSLERRVIPAPRDLTLRERDIVGLIVTGHRNPEIAARLAIREQTVKNHISKIFQKLSVGDRLELSLYAVHHGLYGLPREVRFQQTGKHESQRMPDADLSA